MVRALEKDPEKRLERADEFAAGLYLISQKLRGPGAPRRCGCAAPAEAPVALPPPAFAPAFASAPQATVITPTALLTPACPRQFRRLQPCVDACACFDASPANGSPARQSGGHPKRVGFPMPSPRY